MNKRIGIAMVLIAAAALVSVSAQAWRGDARMALDEAEEVELTGRLILAADEVPKLSAGGTEYLLRIAPALVADAEVRNNATVTVEGRLVEIARRDLLGVDRHVIVTAIEIGGTRYVLSDADLLGRMAGRRSAGPMMMDRRFGGQTDGPMGTPYGSFGRR